MALRDRLAKSGIGSLIKRIKPKPKPKPAKSITTAKPRFRDNIPEEYLAMGQIPISGGKAIQSVLRGIGGGNAIKGGIRAGVPSTAISAGLYMGLTGDGDEGMQAAKPQLPSKKVEVESSDALADILRQKTMTIAMEAGRESPVFFDYVKAFPSSYMEKVSRDPEFAKQMMAGFLAMMQPSEGKNSY